MNRVLASLDGFVERSFLRKVCGVQLERKFCVWHQLTQKFGFLLICRIADSATNAVSTFVECSVASVSSSLEGCTAT